MVVVDGEQGVHRVELFGFVAAEAQRVLLKLRPLLTILAIIPPHPGRRFRTLLTLILNQHIPTGIAT